MGTRTLVSMVSAIALTVVSSAQAQVTQHVGLDSLHPTISSDGRYVAFESFSAAAPGDVNGREDVFVFDRVTGVTTLESVRSNGAQGNSESSQAAISADGRYVAFRSMADNLVPGDTNGTIDVFVHDRQTGQTIRASVDSAGDEPISSSSAPSISADGRFVAFSSFANDLVAGDTNGKVDAFVHDCISGATTRVSVASGGGQGNGDVDSVASFQDVSISGDGRFVAFASLAFNLVPGDTNASQDIFVHDRQTGLTTRASVDSAGVQGNDTSYHPYISADGRFVAFTSDATNLFPGGTPLDPDMFVHDRQTGQTEHVSVSSSRMPANRGSSWPSISADGRFVTFKSEATNLVTPDLNGWVDVFVRDRLSGQTTRVNVSSSGAQANALGEDAVISNDGRYVAFMSTATNLDPAHPGTAAFVHDRDADGFISLCDPGVAGVISCPCSNPPAGAGRGCDNSSATGGASLTASGAAYLATDSLVFTTSAEKPTAFSIVLQGTASIPAGAIYGQGVRCAGGSLKRLYTKPAVGGSITAPNLGGGDPTVSARSAALGDLIQAGESRWYLVYYRDPNVLGGCPASSTFNATQTGRVTWWP